LSWFFWKLLFHLLRQTGFFWASYFFLLFFFIHLCFVGDGCPDNRCAHPPPLVASLSSTCSPPSTHFRTNERQQWSVFLLMGCPLLPCLAHWRIVPAPPCPAMPRQQLFYIPGNSRSIFFRQPSLDTRRSQELLFFVIPLFFQTFLRIPVLGQVPPHFHRGAHSFAPLEPPTHCPSQAIYFPFNFFRLLSPPYGGRSRTAVCRSKETCPPQPPLPFFFLRSFEPFFVPNAVHPPPLPFKKVCYPCFLTRFVVEPRPLPILLLIHPFPSIFSVVNITLGQQWPFSPIRTKVFPIVFSWFQYFPSCPSFKRVDQKGPFHKAHRRKFSPAPQFAPVLHEAFFGVIFF